MKIVILDAYTENPGDLSWKALEQFGELTVYDRTPMNDEVEIIRRINYAEIVLTNKTPIAVRRSWDVWSGIPVHLQVFWQMSAIVVMYWQERPLHRTF